MPKEKNLSRTSLCSLVSALLMLALLILQFTPFWQYGDGETASIGAYVWFPSDNAAVGAAIKESVGDDFSVENIVGVAVLTLVLSAAGAAVCLIKPASPIVSVMPVACGLVGIIGLLAKPALRLGMNWGLHLALCVAMLLVGLAGLCGGLAGRGAGTARKPSAAA